MTRRGWLLFVALGAAAPKIVDFILFLWRERTPALQWRLDFVFPCFGLFVISLAVRCLVRPVRLFCPACELWTDEPGDPACPGCGRELLRMRLEPPR